MNIVAYNLKTTLNFSWIASQTNENYCISFSGTHLETQVFLRIFVYGTSHTTPFAPLVPFSRTPLLASVLSHYSGVSWELHQKNGQSFILFVESLLWNFCRQSVISAWRFLKWSCASVNQRKVARKTYKLRGFVLQTYLKVIS